MLLELQPFQESGIPDQLFDYKPRMDKKDLAICIRQRIGKINKFGVQKLCYQNSVLDGKPYKTQDFTVTHWKPSLQGVYLVLNHIALGPRRP